MLQTWLQNQAGPEYFRKAIKKMAQQSVELDNFLRRGEV
jgi:hypothetical protein